MRMILILLGIPCKAIVMCIWEPSKTDAQINDSGLDRLSLGIFRAKGFVHLQEFRERRGLLQMVGKRVQITVDEPWGAESPRTALVFSGEAGVTGPARLQAMVEACRPGSSNPLVEKLEDLIRWIREM